MALLNYLCVFSTSLAVQRRTPLEIRQKHSRILLYMHRCRIVSSVNSWVARLLRLPPMFRFVRLGVQRENHCDCASSSPGQTPRWRKPKTDCHNRCKLVSDPMTILNDGPFITLAEVFTAYLDGRRTLPWAINWPPKLNPRYFALTLEMRFHDHA